MGYSLFSMEHPGSHLLHLVGWTQLGTSKVLVSSQRLRDNQSCSAEVVGVACRHRALDCTSEVLTQGPGRPPDFNIMYFPISFKKLCTNACASSIACENIVMVYSHVQVHEIARILHKT
jgi:hypothetical protein